MTLRMFIDAYVVMKALLNQTGKRLMSDRICSVCGCNILTDEDLRRRAAEEVLKRFDEDRTWENFSKFLDAYREHSLNLPINGELKTK